MPLTKDELMEFLASLPWKFNAQGYAIIKRSHVVLWADGRPIGPKQIAHHKNENKSDDRPENLEVVTWKEHARLHGLHERGGRVRGKLSLEQLQKRREKMMGNQLAKGAAMTPERRRVYSQRMKEVWRKRREGHLPMPTHGTVQ